MHKAGANYAFGILANSDLDLGAKLAEGKEEDYLIVGGTTNGGRSLSFLNLDQKLSSTKHGLLRNLALHQFPSIFDMFSQFFLGLVIVAISDKLQNPLMII